MQPLGSGQRSRIEQLARDKGAACPCGSRDLRSGDVARLYVGGSATVDLYCMREGAYHGDEGAYQIFDLSPEEARHVGIDLRPRDLPETTG